MSVMEGLAGRVTMFGWLLVGGAAFMGGGDVWRVATQETAQARVVAVKERCWLTVIGSDGRPRSDSMACVEAERAKAARPGEALKVGRSTSEATLEFKTAKGETIRIEPSASVFKLTRAKVGDVVALAYDPEKPRSVRTPAQLENLGTAKWMGILGVVLLWLGGVLRKASGATKDGLSELAKALRNSAESVAAKKPAGKGGFAAMDRLATGSPIAKSVTHAQPTKTMHASLKPLPKGTPRVVSPRRHGLLGLFR